MVTYGAQEALYCAITGNIKSKDEVIIIEPFYDSYKPMVTFAGGICRFTSLKPTSKCWCKASDWVLDREELTSLFNEKTKLIIINTPQNPIGKVYVEEELLFIGSLCKKWNVVCILDEVYEWFTYGDAKHFRMGKQCSTLLYFFQSYF